MSLFCGDVTLSTDRELQRKRLKTSDLGERDACPGVIDSNVLDVYGLHGDIPRQTLSQRLLSLFQVAQSDMQNSPIMQQPDAADNTTAGSGNTGDRFSKTSTA